MNGETDLNKLLRTISPSLDSGEYVFVSLSGKYGDYARLEPIGSFTEKEGLTLIVSAKTARENSLEFSEVFRMITLEVHSSLNAVGLTAAVAARLKDENISANVVAGYYHDHIFVQSRLADKALEALKDLV